ncbi:MAG: NRDE family protein, partial [Burkholderiaceae bacterium]|nr:NRDE family protein [Burkholderiaceae bacterium]
TWMGVASNGRVAFLTNIRPGTSATGSEVRATSSTTLTTTTTTTPLVTAAAAPLPEPAPRSRGGLCTSWLSGTSWPSWQNSNPAHEFAGCNVVLGDLHTGEWHFARNQVPLRMAQDHQGQSKSKSKSKGQSHGHGEGKHQDQDPSQHPGNWHTRELGAGVYALSNADLDTPWPKTMQLKAALTQALGRPPVTAISPTVTPATSTPSTQETQETQEAQLLHALQDSRCLEPGDALSGVFVHWAAAQYGTRSSTIMRCEADTPKVVHMSEWRYDSHAQLLDHQPKRLDMVTCSIPASINDAPTT